MDKIIVKINTSVYKFYNGIFVKLPYQNRIDYYHFIQSNEQKYSIYISKKEPFLCFIHPFSIHLDHINHTCFKLHLNQHQLYIDWNDLFDLKAYIENEKNIKIYVLFKSLNGIYICCYEIPLSILKHNLRKDITSLNHYYIHCDCKHSQYIKLNLDSIYETFDCYKYFFNLISLNYNDKTQLFDINFDLYNLQFEQIDSCVIHLPCKPSHYYIQDGLLYIVTDNYIYTMCIFTKTIHTIYTNIDITFKNKNILYNPLCESFIITKYETNIIRFEYIDSGWNSIYKIDIKIVDNSYDIQSFSYTCNYDTIQYIFPLSDECNIITKKMPLPLYMDSMSLSYIYNKCISLLTTLTIEYEKDYYINAFSNSKWILLTKKNTIVVIDIECTKNILIGTIILMNCIYHRIEYYYITNKNTKFQIKFNEPFIWICIFSYNIPLSVTLF